MALLLDQILGIGLSEIGFSGSLKINIGANRPHDTGGTSTAASSNFEGLGGI
jgi:hypothetical protein